MNSILEKVSNMKSSILRFGVQARAVIREVCTFEFLGLATMLLPALMASVGFFFGKTVTPVYFYAAVAILTCAAFLAGWRRGLAYLALLAVCAALTMYTFSYVGYDAQTYHFPMQYLLRHGWNPVFDSTIEKFGALVGDAQLWFCHTLFLPKFNELCGALVASSFHLFSGDAFFGYVLVACLFAACMKFAKRYWQSPMRWCALFASVLAFSPRMTAIQNGYVDYSTYASFVISAFALVLYQRDRMLADLMTFFFATCICMVSKTTGILCCGMLVVLALLQLYRRLAYWRVLFGIGVVVAIVAAAPLLTNWIQYGSPFYPSLTFNTNVPVVDITSDFTCNGDAQSMGYLSRICYAWISPELTVAAIRLLSGKSGFNPIFDIHGGVAGIGLWFNALLVISVALLAFSRKNAVTLLCAVVFASSNLAPLKFIGFSRYFPQIWMIFPLAGMNFAFTSDVGVLGRRKESVRSAVVLLLAVILVGLTGWSTFRVLSGHGRQLVFERFRQNLMESFPHERPIKVEGNFYRFTAIQRFRQAGIRVVKSENGDVDTIVGEKEYDAPYYQLLNMPGKHDDMVPLQKEFALPCFDDRLGVHSELYASMDFCYPIEEKVKALFSRYKWRALFELMPHVLWDNNEGDSK